MRATTSGAYNKDDGADCGVAIIPCCFGRRAKFRRMATTGIFLLLLVVFTVLLSLAEGFLFAFSKLLMNLFSFPPSFYDWLKSSSGLFQGLAAITVAYWGNRIKRPAFLGGLGCLIALLSFIATIPFSVNSPTDRDLNSTLESGAQLCEREVSTPADLVTGTSDGIILMITTGILLALISLTYVSYFSHGVTYLDDFIKPDKMSHSIAIIYIHRLLYQTMGPSILSFFSEKPSLWWLPIFISGLLILTFGYIIACFPQRLTSVSENKAECESTESSSQNSSTLNDIIDDGISEDYRFCPTLKRIITNKVLLFNTLALSVFAMGGMHFEVYEHSFIHSRFHIATTDYSLDPWTSRILEDKFKTMIVLTVVMIPGIVFAKKRLPLKTIASFNMLMAVYTTSLFLIFIFLNCNKSPIVGAEGTLACSQDCGCDSAQSVFDPVCMIDSSETYFSPCRAGCTGSMEINNILIFENCTCGSSIDGLTISPGRATRGVCDSDKCYNLWTVFQTLRTMNYALTSATSVTHLLLTLRCVQPSDKATAVGFLMAGIGIISYMPGYIVYRKISESTCISWNSDGYTCNLHSDTFPAIMSGVTAGLCFVSAVLFFIVTRAAGKVDQARKKKKTVSDDAGSGVRSVE